MGLRISFLTLAGQHHGIQDLYSLLFDHLHQARVCTGFPGQVSPTVLLRSWRKLQAVLSVPLPLEAGLLDEVYSSLCALVRVPHQVG